MAKRIDYISWEELFMMEALIASKRSKDPVTQVGAVIVTDNKVVGTGYNGFTNGMSDDAGLWGKDETDKLRNKHFYVCHSELNAILNSNGKTKGGTIYVTLFCCSECCKAIIQSGITTIVYANEGSDKVTYKASRIMLKAARVKIVKYTGRRKLTLDFDENNGRMSKPETKMERFIINLCMFAVIICTNDRLLEWGFWDKLN
jgi:dCMP deaminase